MNFKYFSDYKKNADFTNEPCEICGSSKDCLTGIYFEFEEKMYENIDSICLNCFLKNNFKRDIPDFLKNNLIKSLQKISQDKNMEEIILEANEKIKELEKNPPIPWIQNNDWQICCGDFCNYIGEWGQDEFNKNSPDGDGKKYLMEILNDFDKSRVVNLDYFWEEIEIDTAVFVFKCNYCNKYIATVQSF